jgi:hypothetical protein
VKFTRCCLIYVAAFLSVNALNAEPLLNEIDKLRQEARRLAQKADSLEQKVMRRKATKGKGQKLRRPNQQPGNLRQTRDGLHDATVKVHAINGHPESVEFYPAALLADEQVVTYIAGTPVVTSPYLGERPAFDGSDLIVNISSINQDVRLMQQRRRLYMAYRKMGYPVPHIPIIALSGALEPYAFVTNPFIGRTTGTTDLGRAELDIAAAVNEWVEGYISLSYNDSPSLITGTQVERSVIYLSKGFVNIGNLEKTPVYFTAGQIVTPFGRFSSSMVSANLPSLLAKTTARPFILGYKTQNGPGIFAAIYGFRSDVTLGKSGVGGINIGHTFHKDNHIGEIGASFISNIADANGMQNNGSVPGTTFGGFGSILNGSQMIRKVPAFDAHFSWSMDAFSVTLEYVTATKAFRMMDLSFMGVGAKPHAANVEGAITFKAWDKPASLAAGYQRTSSALALNLPRQRVSGVFNISLWKDTVESLEYRHDIDYKVLQFANGANSIVPGAPANLPTFGTGKTRDTLTAQVAIYF